MSQGTQFQDARESIKTTQASFVAHTLAFLPGTIAVIPEGYTPPPLTLNFGTEGGGWTVQADYHNLNFVALFGARQGHDLPSESYIVFTAQDWDAARRQSHERLFWEGIGRAISLNAGHHRTEIDRQSNDEMRLDADQDGAS